jgi:hypothetical protein
MLQHKPGVASIDLAERLAEAAGDGDDGEAEAAEAAEAAGDKPKRRRAGGKRVDRAKDLLEEERRTWRDKAYTLPDGEVIVPRLNLWRNFYDGCREWGGKISGRGLKQFSSIFKMAVFVLGDLRLGVYVNDESRVRPYGHNVKIPKTGGAGGSMVYRIRPLIESWEGTVDLLVTDDRLTPEALAMSIAYGGKLGVCDWRPLFGTYTLKGMQKLTGKDIPKGVTAHYAAAGN